MRAVVVRAFGEGQPVEIGDVGPPLRLGTEVLVDVHAAGLNPIDWKTIEGRGAAAANSSETASSEIAGPQKASSATLERSRRTTIAASRTAEAGVTAPQQLSAT